LWDAPGAGAIINWTNVVTPERTLGRIASTTFNWFWKNTYSNLQTGTLAVIERSVDRVVAASAVASASSAELTILEQTQFGATRTPATAVDYSAWTYGLWKYGYAPIYGTFNRTTYSLGTAGSSNYVSFGGAQLQAVDENITASEATALAYTELDTLDKLYDRSMAWKCISAENSQYPTLADQLATGSGTALDFGSINIVIDGAAASAFAVNTGTNTITIKSTTLQKGTKFSAITTTGTVTFANGTISNLTVNGNVSQATPANLSNATITGSLTYNTNTNASISITNTSIGTVANSGTGIVTITPNDSSITTYTDSEINFLDSNITFAGVDSITFYPTSGNADTGANAGATITTSPYNFKYGSVISGVTMIGTLNIRYSIGGKVTIGTLTIALGGNSFVLTDNELLGSINASVALTAKESTLLQTEADIIDAIGSGGGGGGSLTAADVWTYSTRTLTTAIPTAAQNATAVRSELATEIGRIDVATSTRLSTAGYTAPPSPASIRSEIDSNSTKLDVAVGTRLSSAGYTAPANADITAIKNKTDNLPSDPASDTTVNTRLSSASYTAPDNSGIVAIKAKTDNLPADPADNSDILSAISAIPSAPSASVIADEVRTELATELGRIDASVSSRLATSSYVAPANSDISAIKAKTDNLPSDPADNSDILTAISGGSSPSVIADAVRTELATELARIDVAISTRNSVEPDNTSIGTILTEVNSHPTLAEIEASSVLAKELTIGEIKANTDLIPAAL
jgi:hypothetical protein